MPPRGVDGASIPASSVRKNIMKGNIENVILSNQTQNLIEDLMRQRLSLQTQFEAGIINSVDVTTEIELISKKERKLKEQLIEKLHVTESGEMRSIHHHEPTPENPKDYYITKLANGTKIKGSTYESLLNKLYIHYTDGLSDFSIGKIFKVAVKEKEVTENPDPKTILKDKNDFKRFITDDFAKRDIRHVTELDIKKYCQKWVTSAHPKKKTYLTFKSLLNIIFRYAKRHHIIDVNPLESISNKPYLKSCDTTKPKPEDKILSPEEIDSLKEEVRHRMTLKKYGKYYIHGYAMLFAIETGVRVAELCALKWEDILPDRIHIHAQQLHEKLEGGKKYYLAPYTKNEKGISEDGRDFPLTKSIKALLEEIKSLQDEMGIKSEFIFCHEDGEWIKTDAYLTFLRRLCRSKNLKVTNNHALRMSLNSNVLLPLGISVADRAAMLGHSIETNLKFYSYAQKGYLSSVCDLLDENSERSPLVPPSAYSEDAKIQDSYENSDQKEPLGTPGNPSNIILFNKEKSPRPAKSQAFS